MTRARLSGKIGAGLDPCAAMQAGFDLAPGEERQIVFTLGAGASAEEARQLADRFRGAEAARAALEGVWQYWKHTLGAVNVETPDASLNVLANGWLLYQTLVVPFLGAQRILPERRRLRLPRSVAGRDGADPLPSRGCCANICCAARPGSSAKATCSTGGIRPRAAACARIVRTTISGCRWRRAATWPAPATPGCWTKTCASWKAGRSTPKKIPTTTCRGVPKRRPACTSTAREPSCTACGSGSTACR